MTATRWRDEDLERHLWNLGAGGTIPGVPTMSEGIVTRTHMRLGGSRPEPRIRTMSAAVIAMAALLLIPATLSAMGNPGLVKTILGIPVSVSNMDPAEWIRRGFSGWLASPGAPEFLSPEETVEVAPFPIRVPTWLPEGYEALGQPKGAYSHVYADGRWETREDIQLFFVSQGFLPAYGKEAHPLSVMHAVRPRQNRGVTLPPGTLTMEIKGHPAFVRTDMPLGEVSKENEDRSKRGELPEIVGYENQLEIWVEEPDGQITQITISGAFPQEVLIRVGESLFNS